MVPLQEETFIEYTGHRIPFVIIRERRRTVRVAFSRKTVTLRLPWTLAAAENTKHIENSKKWVIDQLKRKPGLIHHFYTRIYRHGEVIRVAGRQYVLYMLDHQGKTNKALLKGQLIELQLAPGSGEEKNEAIKYLVSRLIANDCHEMLESRVRELNRTTFNRPVQTVRIKLNQSNWGSCSSKGNINLSARLLFAPRVVMDYVIIHELAHLVEHNHGPRFWALVAKAIPEYQTYEQWLKDNSHLCEF